jgi:hypothetical protein
MEGRASAQTGPEVCRDLLVISRIADHEEASARVAVHDEVVQDAALVVATARVNGTAVGDSFQVIRNQAIDFLQSMIARHFQAPHMRDVEESSAFAYGGVLGYDAGVLDGH